MATFITSKAIGDTIGIYVQTSTGFWKYNHDGTDSSVFSNPWNGSVPVTNANGEFTLISCDSDGTVNGDITNLQLGDSQITSFDGTGLSSLTQLQLDNNQLTSFDGTGLSSLTNLYLNNNQLTSFDGAGLSILTNLYLNNSQLTTFDGTGLSSLTFLVLNGNLLTSFDGTGLSSLTQLFLSNNQLTSFNGTGLSSLTELRLDNNQLTSFNGTGLSSLIFLELPSNQLISLDGTGLSSLTDLSLQDNLLTSLDVSPLVNLHYLRLYTMGEKGEPTLTNPITPSSNNQILFDLAQHSINGGQFISTNGRTSASNADYDNLVNNLGWSLSGLDSNETTTTTTTEAPTTTTTTTSAPVTGNGKMRIKGLTSGGGTTTTTTTEAPTTTTTTTMAPPTSNATNFLIKSVSLTGSTLQALTEFRLANPLVDGYLVTMDDLSDPIYGNGANSLSNSVLSIVNGTSYSIGDTIGINTFNSQPNGTIVKVGPATNVSIIDGFDTERFTIPNIQGGQNGHTFEFNVYAYNLDSNGSPVYNVNNPLTTALVVQQTSSGGGKGGQKKG